MAVSYEFHGRFREDIPQPRGYIVDRPEIQAAMQDAMFGSSAVTWVDGPPAIGKTVAVARALEENGEDAAWITGMQWRGFSQTRKGFSVEKMRSEMSEMACAIDASLTDTDEGAESRFTEFLRTPRAPNHVIIDNYDPDVFPQLLEPQSSEFVPHITIISRDPPTGSIADDVSRVTVGNLTIEESRELIGLYLPDSSNDQRDQFADLVDYRAHRIDRGCRRLELSAYLTIDREIGRLRDGGLLGILDNPDDLYYYEVRNNNLARQALFTVRRGYQSPYCPREQQASGQGSQREDQDPV
ncbi:hypothetical protein ACQPXH_23950 [Nocardia sp. CA-135953]|uniref:hypothetical protein n=1 Tax=Nocardia sp. CA-135953 TaxID=3239978 RepID=UPI003D954AEC